MKKLSDELKGIKRELIYANSAIIVLGLLMTIFPETSGDVLCRAIGAVLAVWGLIKIITYFTGDRTIVLGSFALVEGTAAIGFGVYFLVKPDFLSQILTAIFAIILIIGSVMKFQYGFDFMRLKASGWWIQLIGAAVMAGLGIVSLINPFDTANILMIFIGIGLVVDGVWDLISVIWLSKVAKEFKKAFDASNPPHTDDTNYIDTTAEKTNEE